jgi:hypothetical protein
MVTWEADKKAKSHPDMMKEMQDMMMTLDPMVVEKTQTQRHH